MSYSPISTHRFGVEVPLAGVAGGQAPAVAVAVLLWALVSIAPMPRMGRASTIPIATSVTRIELPMLRSKLIFLLMVPPCADCGQRSDCWSDRRPSPAIAGPPAVFLTVCGDCG